MVFPGRSVAFCMSLRDTPWGQPWQDRRQWQQQNTHLGALESHSEQNTQSSVHGKPNTHLRAITSTEHTFGRSRHPVNSHTQSVVFKSQSQHNTQSRVHERQSPTQHTLRRSRAPVTNTAHSGAHRTQSRQPNSHGGEFLHTGNASALIVILVMQWMIN